MRKRDREKRKRGPAKPTAQRTAEYRARKRAKAMREAMALLDRLPRVPDDVLAAHVAALPAAIERYVAEKHALAGAPRQSGPGKHASPAKRDERG